MYTLVAFYPDAEGFLQAHAYPNVVESAALCKDMLKHVWLNLFNKGIDMTTVALRCFPVNSL